MRRQLTVVTVAVGLLMALTACSDSGSGPGTANHARTLCDSQRAEVAGGSYIVQNNRYGTTAPECLTLDVGTGFEVTQSSIQVPTDGGPGGYPSIYQGCHWGECGSGGLAKAPMLVADLAPGRVTTSWSTDQPAGGAYNAAYDIWFNKTPVASGQPDCAELMVWLDHTGGVEPFGSPMTAGVSLGGHTYDVWGGPQRWGDTITYLMTTPTTSVAGLDVGILAQDAVHRGYLSQGCYLIDIEAGFEIWQAGAGLTTKSFSVQLRPVS
jgi:Glycosyl hydrolase family 12